MKRQYFFHVTMIVGLILVLVGIVQAQGADHGRVPTGDTYSFSFSPGDGESGCNTYAQTRLELSELSSGRLRARAEKCTGSFNADGHFQLSVDGDRIDDWIDNYNAGDSGESMYVDFIERFGNPYKWYTLQGWVGSGSIPDLETETVDLRVSYSVQTSSPPVADYQYEVSTTTPQCSPGDRQYGALELRPNGSQIEVRLTKCNAGEGFNDGGVAVLWIDGQPYGTVETYAQGDTLVSFYIDPAREGFSDTAWHTYTMHLGVDAHLQTGSVDARVVEVVNQPNLQVDASSVETVGPYFSGSSIGVQARVENAGNATSGSSDLGYYISNSYNGSPLDVGAVRVNSVSSLGVGSNSTYLYEDVYIPRNLSPGTYYVVFQADYNGNVTESSESDNKASRSFTIEACDTSNMYCDMPDSNVFQESAEAIQGELTNGCRSDNDLYNNAVFCPEMMLDRGSMAVFSVRHAMGQYDPQLGPYQGYFADVPSSHPQALWIEKAHDLGIVNGCGNGNFCPDYDTSGESGWVTRANIAIFLGKTAGWELNNPTTGIFEDVTGDSYWERAVEYMYRNGYTNGASQGCENSPTPPSGLYYCPNDFVQRQQMAAFTARAWEYLESVECFGVFSNIVPDDAGEINITPEPDCPSDRTKWRRDINTRLFISATANEGYRFLEWRGHTVGDVDRGWFEVPDDKSLMIVYAVFDTEEIVDHCSRIIDLNIGLYRTSVNDSVKRLYEEAVEHTAYALFESTNGYQCLGNVSWYLGGDNMDQTFLDVVWIESCHPNAHLSRYFGDALGRIEMCDTYDFNPPFNALSSPVDGGRTLMHEFGHYGLGLCDEYVNSSQEGGVCRPGRNDVGVNDSIMNSQWQAEPNNWGWLNFSTDFNNNSPTNGHFRAYEASGWGTLNRHPSEDPMICSENNCIDMQRDDFPEFRKVDSNTAPSIELDSEGTNVNALANLSQSWLQGRGEKPERQLPAIDIVNPKDLTFNEGEPMVFSFAAYLDGYYVTNLDVSEVEIEGNVFAANDDGVNNDVLANDGIYTVSVDRASVDIGVDIPIKVRLVNIGTGTSVILPQYTPPPPGYGQSLPVPTLVTDVFDVSIDVVIGLVGSSSDHGNEPDTATLLMPGSEVHGEVSNNNPDYFFIERLSNDYAQNGYQYRVFVYNKVGDVVVDGREKTQMLVPNSGGTFKLSGDGNYTVKLIRTRNSMSNVFLPFLQR